MRYNCMLYTIILMMTVCLAACGYEKETEDPGTLETGRWEAPDALEAASEEGPDIAEVLGTEPEDKQIGQDETQVDEAEQKPEENDLPPQPANPEEELFMQFLNDEIEAVISDTFVDDISYLSFGKESLTESFTGCFTYKEFIAALNAGDNHFLDPSEVERYYAFFSTVDGGEIFAVRFQNLGIYSDGDDSYADFFFAVNEGILYLTYAADSWCRSYTIVAEPLAFAGIGSGGARHHYIWSGYIDKTGQYYEIFNQEILSDKSWCEGCTFSMLEMQDGTRYYCYYCEDDEHETEDVEEIAAYLASLEEDGMIRVETNKEMTGMVDTAYEEIGFEEALMPFKSWIALD